MAVLAQLPVSSTLDATPTTPPAAQTTPEGSNAMTIAALVLVVSGAVLILGGLLYAWTVRRRRPTVTFHNLLIPSKRHSDAASIASWHGVPENANLWKVSAGVTRPSRASSPPPDYIPYRGPIAPPRLPLPAALRALVNRPLPSLPGEKQTKRETYNALGLRFDDPDPQPKPKPKLKSQPQPQPQPQPQLPPPAAKLDALSARVDSIISEVSGTGTGIPDSSRPPSLAVTARAFNGQRQTATVLHSTSTDFKSMLTRSASQSKSVKSSKPSFLNRSQSQKLLSRKPSTPFVEKQEADVSFASLLAPPKAAAAPLTRRATTANVTRKKSTSTRKPVPSEYPFVGYGSGDV